jgi:uncharacterized protein
MMLDMGMATMTDADEPLIEAGESRRGRASPLRRCLVTRNTLPKAALIRFVAAPDGMIVPDVDGKLPGHGFWVTADRASLEQACRRNLFAKAAKQSLSVPVGTLALVEKLLTRRCLDLIGLARRAGAAVAGFEKCRAWLQAGRAGLLLAASDGAADGRAKMRALAGGLPLVELFTSAEISQALSHDNTVHAVVAPGGFVAKLTTEAERLKAIRPMASLEECVDDR